MGKNTKLIEDYREKLATLSFQAKQDGRETVYDFLQAILEHSPEDVDLYEFIYTTADEITDNIIPLYQRLLERNSELSWYKFVSFLNEEVDDAAPYFPYVIKCIDNGIDVKVVENLLQESKSINEFVCGINARWPEKEEYMEHKAPQEANPDSFLDYLKQQNEELNNRVDFLLKENGDLQQEIKRLMDESFESKKTILEYKHLADQESKKHSSCLLAVKLAAGRTMKFKEMSEQLEDTVCVLRTKIQQLEAKLQECHDTIGASENATMQMKKQLNDKDLLIDQLKKQIADYEDELNSVVSRTEQNDNSLLSMNQPDSFNDTSVIDIPEDIPEEYLEELEENELDDEPEYDESDLIEIKSNKKDVIKVSNIFATLINKRQKNKFNKKTATEQEALIFVKLMEHNFSKDIVRLIKNTLKNNIDFSRYDLYELVSRGASESELEQYCNALE